MSNTQGVTAMDSDEKVSDGRMKLCGMTEICIVWNPTRD